MRTCTSDMFAPRGAPEKTTHPCQFPIELIERCVLAFTNESNWILDPFGGVGSTLIAAIKNDRMAVSIDKEKDYPDIARGRVKRFSQVLLNIRPLGKPYSYFKWKRKGLSNTPRVVIIVMTSPQCGELHEFEYSQEVKAQILEIYRSGQSSQLFACH